MRFWNSICSIYTTFPFFSFFSLHQLRVLFVFYFKISFSLSSSFIHWFFFSKPKTAPPLAEEVANSHDAHHSESAANSGKPGHSKFHQLDAFLWASNRAQRQQVQQRRRRSHDTRRRWHSESATNSRKPKYPNAFLWVSHQTRTKRGFDDTDFVW